MVPVALSVTICALIIVPLLGLAVPLLNGLVTWRLPPRQLAKLDYREGIAPVHRTVVVVPVLLAGRADVERVLERLEVNYLNNEDQQLVYAILGDYAEIGRAHV